MSTKTKKALQKAEAQKQTAVDITAEVPESEKIKIGGMDLNGTKSKKPSTAPAPKAETKPGVDIESLKTRLGAFAVVTTDKSGFIAIRDVNKSVLHYITNTRKGISLYARTNGNWKVANLLSTPEDIDAFITQVQREVAARSGWKESLSPIYVTTEGLHALESQNLFFCTSKKQMEQHLVSLL